MPEDAGAVSACVRGWVLLQPAQTMVVTNAAVATRRVSVIIRRDLLPPNDQRSPAPAHGRGSRRRVQRLVSGLADAHGYVKSYEIPFSSPPTETPA